MPSQVVAPQPVSVFFSYSPEDEPLRDELAKYLRILERQGVIQPWHDRRITPGSERAREIDKHLENADIILLLVSADFLASNYIYGVELKRALERHADPNDRACVIPVILRSVEWRHSSFGNLKALPRDGKPVTGREWHDRDEAFTDVARGVQSAAESIRAKRAIPIGNSASSSSEGHAESGSPQMEPGVDNTFLAAPPEVHLRATSRAWGATDVVGMFSTGIAWSGLTTLPLVVVVYAIIQPDQIPWLAAAIIVMVVGVAALIGMQISRGIIRRNRFVSFVGAFLFAAFSYFWAVGVPEADVLAIRIALIQYALFAAGSALVLMTEALGRRRVRQGSSS